MPEEALSKGNPATFGNWLEQCICDTLKAVKAIPFSPLQMNLRNAL